MKWIKIALLFLVLTFITYYFPQSPDAPGVLLLDAPLMMLWFGFAFTVWSPHPPEMKWGSKEWRVHIDRGAEVSWKQILLFVIPISFVLEIFSQIRWKKSFLAEPLSKLWAWLSSVF